MRSCLDWFQSLSHIKSNLIIYTGPSQYSDAKHHRYRSAIDTGDDADAVTDAGHSANGMHTEHSDPSKKWFSFYFVHASANDVYNSILSPSRSPHLSLPLALSASEFSIQIFIQIPLINQLEIIQCISHCCSHSFNQSIRFGYYPNLCFAHTSYLHNSPFFRYPLFMSIKWENKRGNKYRKFRANFRWIVNCNQIWWVLLFWLLSMRIVRTKSDRLFSCKSDLNDCFVRAYSGAYKLL